jgi:protein-L-isoaspartate O-methyltransferase
MGQIADRVYTVERHPSVGETAPQRLKNLGCDNVDLRFGHGTHPEPNAKRTPTSRKLACRGQLGKDIQLT